MAEYSEHVLCVWEMPGFEARGLAERFSRCATRLVYDIEYYHKWYHRNKYINLMISQKINLMHTIDAIRPSDRICTAKKTEPTAKCCAGNVCAGNAFPHPWCYFVDRLHNVRVECSSSFAAIFGLGDTLALLELGITPSTLHT